MLRVCLRREIAGEVENVERANGVRVAAQDIPLGNQRRFDERTQCCMDVPTEHLYPEVPVDDELIPWPYSSIPRPAADLEGFGPVADRVGESFSDKQKHGSTNHDGEILGQIVK